MNRLDQLFARKQENILNIYFTAGYPTRDATAEIAVGLEKGGADLLEIGIPYSDPLADGPTIQKSGAQAIRNGMSLPLLLEQVKEIRTQSQIPIVLMGYLNQVQQYGFERFCVDAKDAGVDGLILPDLPMDIYPGYYQNAVEKSELRFTFLITPQTSEERVRVADALSSGFLYMVSQSSITGSALDSGDTQAAYFNRIASMGLASPRLIGFGISDKTSFDRVCRFAQGGIIGSAFIRALENATDASDVARRFAEEIRA